MLLNLSKFIRVNQLLTVVKEPQPLVLEAHAAPTVPQSLLESSKLEAFQLVKLFQAGTYTNFFLS